MTSYHELVSTVLDEHRRVLAGVSEEETGRLLEALATARCIQVFGLGRMQCAARAFVMRLMHMGLDAHVVYDTTCPNIGPGDLLVSNCACTTIDYTVMGFAKRLGARVAAITADPCSKAAKLCDFTVNLKGQVHGGRGYEIASVQPMASLFEQAIFIYEDVVVQLLMQKLGITAAEMARRHTNLDGYMDFNTDDEH